MIVFKRVTKKFGQVTVLSDVQLRIDPGEFVCVTGPSGAGKSTLIRLLIGAEGITKGSIEVDGIDLRKIPPTAMQLYRQHLGIVFQEHALLQNRTVEENIAFPLEVCGFRDGYIRTRIPAILKRMDLTARAKAFPRQLSGGEKARAAIARAVATNPSILILDEPTGNVDPGQSMMILAMLREIHAAGTTVILATHDAGLVDSLQTRVVRLEKGTIIRDGKGGYDAAPAAANDVVRRSMDAALAVDGGQKIKITPIGSIEL